LTLLKRPRRCHRLGDDRRRGASISMGSIGQNGAVTFSGTQGQQATVHITNNTVNGVVNFKLLSTDGITVLASTAAFFSAWISPPRRCGDGHLHRGGRSERHDDRRCDRVDHQP